MGRRKYSLKDPYTWKVIFSIFILLVIMVALWIVNEKTDGWVREHFDYRKNLGMKMYHLLDKLHLTILMPIFVWYMSYLGLKDMINRYKKYQKIGKVFTFENIFFVVGGILFLLIALTDPEQIGIKF